MTGFPSPSSATWSSMPFVATCRCVTANSLWESPRSADEVRGMSVNDLVLVEGMADTRATLSEWNRRPGRVLAHWLAWSVLVALGLLVAVDVVAKLSTPDLTPMH